MVDDKIQELMMKVVDGVANETERREFERLTKNDNALRDEYIAMKKIKEVTDTMRFAEMPDQFWQGYWGSIYNRLERGLGWILMSVGAIVLLAFGMFQLFKDFFLNPEFSIVVRGGAFVGGAGAIILLWSLLRETLFARRKERYKELER